MHVRFCQHQHEGQMNLEAGREGLGEKTWSLLAGTQQRSDNGRHRRPKCWELRIETVLIAECKARSLEIRMFNWISLGGDSPPLMDALALVGSLSRDLRIFHLHWQSCGPASIKIWDGVYSMSAHHLAFLSSSRILSDVSGTCDVLESQGEEANPLKGAQYL